jgi:hypothetical protein
MQNHKNSIFSWCDRGEIFRSIARIFVTVLEFQQFLGLDTGNTVEGVLPLMQLLLFIIPNLCLRVWLYDPEVHWLRGSPLLCVNPKLRVRNNIQHRYVKDCWFTCFYSLAGATLLGRLRWQKNKMTHPVGYQKANKTRARFNYINPLFYIRRIKNNLTGVKWV